MWECFHGTKFDHSGCYKFMKRNKNIWFFLNSGGNHRNFLKVAIIQIEWNNYNILSKPTYVHINMMKEWWKQKKFSVLYKNSAKYGYDEKHATEIIQTNFNHLKFQSSQ